MKKILLLAFLLFPSFAWASCGGVFPADYICGSIGGGPPGPVPFGSFPTLPMSANANFVYAGPTSGSAATATFRLLVDGDIPADVAFLTKPNQVLNGGGATVVTYNNSTITSGSTFTPNCGNGPLQRLGNNGPFTILPPITDSSCDFQFTNAASAGTVTVSGFAVNASYAGGSFDTISGHKFFFHIEEINGSAIYTIVPQQ